MHIVLYQPEIPPNTGNIARLCAATATRLHLIEPLGFKIDDKHMKRAGLDYWPSVNLSVHPHWAAFEAAIYSVSPRPRIILTSARGGAPHHSFRFLPGDAIVLGPETRGLPETIFDLCPLRVRIPVLDTVRSLNLSTSAGILLYEALRQTGDLDALP
ncbi:tRNA (cytidine(34)-2'-O)-methyltransferase [Humidesulfovibrio sp.]